MDRPDIVAAMALACLAGGAAGLRIEGADNLAAVRTLTDAPIIAITKTDLPGSPVRITVTLQDVHALRAAGADIIAFDATDRPRPVGRDAIVAEILGGFVMAEGRYNTPDLAAEALRAGADGVTVGSALTRLEHVTGWFAAAIKDAGLNAGQ